MTIDLFTPIKVGPLQLKNRIVMAPMTRNRASTGNVPTAMNALYYAQRATAGLIISEADFGDGAWLPGHTRYPQRTADRRLEAGDQGGA